MSSMEPEEFQKLLDEHYKWPAEYMFKFIVKTELIDSVMELETVFSSLELIEKTTRSSHGGKYTSYTVRAHMKSSADVVEVYKKVFEIEGVVSL